MQIALIADPHLSLTDAPHSNIRLADTVAITQAIVRDLGERRPDLALWLGDLTHEGTDAVRAHFKRMALGVNVPCLWMLGNHDVEYVTKRQFVQQTVPCVSQMRFRAAGWEVLILDTVEALMPGNPIGRLSETDRILLRDAALHAEGPLLVIAHHPMRTKYLATDPFWSDVAPFSGAGVYIGGHSHRDIHSVENGWHLLDVSSCCRSPQGYHWVELRPEAIVISFVPITVEGIGPGPTDWAPDEPIFPLTIPVRSTDRLT